MSRQKSVFPRISNIRSIGMGFDCQSNKKSDKNRMLSKENARFLSLICHYRIYGKWVIEFRQLSSSSNNSSSVFNEHNISHFSPFVKPPSHLKDICRKNPNFLAYLSQIHIPWFPLFINPSKNGHSMSVIFSVFRLQDNVLFSSF